MIDTTSLFVRYKNMRAHAPHVEVLSGEPVVFFPGLNHLPSDERVQALRRADTNEQSAPYSIRSGKFGFYYRKNIWASYPLKHAPHVVADYDAEPTVQVTGERRVDDHRIFRTNIDL